MRGPLLRAGVVRGFRVPAAAGGELLVRVHEPPRRFARRLRDLVLAAHVFWTLSLASAARSLTSAAALWPSALTLCTASAAVDLTLSSASWAGSFRSWTISLAVSVTWVASGWAAVLSCSAAWRSLVLAGIRDDRSIPAPNAISPAARGLPCAAVLT